MAKVVDGVVVCMRGKGCRFVAGRLRVERRTGFAKVVERVVFCMSCSEMGRIELEGWVGFAKVVQRVVFSIIKIFVVLSESYHEWIRIGRGYEWTGCFYV